MVSVPLPPQEAVMMGAGSSHPHNQPRVCQTIKYPVIMVSTVVGEDEGEVEGDCARVGAAEGTAVGRVGLAEGLAEGSSLSLMLRRSEGGELGLALTEGAALAVGLRLAVVASTALLLPLPTPNEGANCLVASSSRRKAGCSSTVSS